MDEYVKLAKQSIKFYLKENKYFSIPDNLPEEMIKKKSGVFVSLHKSNGDLRGCIGTFLPTKKNIAQEIIENAVDAAIRDFRFTPLKINELDNININVDILNEPEEIKSNNELNPKKYGIIIKTTDNRIGLLLPNIEGVKTIEEQISIACQKANINPNKENYKIFRFTVIRHK